MGVDYYLVREDNKTRFDIGKAYAFAEFWDGPWHESQFNDIRIDPRSGPFHRAMRGQLNVYGFTESEIVTAMNTIEDFSDDRIVILASHYGRFWMQCEEVGTVFGEAYIKRLRATAT